MTTNIRTERRGIKRVHRCHDTVLTELIGAQLCANTDWEMIEQSELGHDGITMARWLEPCLIEGGNACAIADGSIGMAMKHW